MCESGRVVRMEKVNVDKVFKEYGLEVQQVEPSVYKVLNTEKEISVDELQKDLEYCVLLTSERKGKKRLSTGGCYTLAYIYYIVTDVDNIELGYKYDNIASQEFGKVIYDSYEYDPKGECTIDTIYARGEI